MNDFALFRPLAARTANSFTEKIILLDQVDSTNEYAKKLLLQQNISENTAVVADHQVKGKGRLGRVWKSPPGVGLWMSFILKPQLKPDQFFLITYMASVAVAEAVEQMTSLSAELKWPNDVLLNGKKCCGILLESVTKDSQPYVIAGIGINVNQTEFPLALQDTATSLRIESGRAWKRHELFSEILSRLGALYPSLDRSILEKWKLHSNLFGRKVDVTQANHTFEATAIDLADDGALIVEREGKHQNIYAADVRISM